MIKVNSKVITLKNLFVKIAPKCALDNEGNPMPLTVAITWKYYLVIALAIFIFLEIVYTAWMSGRNYELEIQLQGLRELLNEN